MKKIGVLGTGGIGCIMGGYLANACEDVTLISAFRRSVAELISEKGLFVEGVRGDFSVNVKAKYLGDLTESDQFDLVFIALKSNDLVTAVTRLEPHLKKDGCAVTLGNGINEEFIIPILGKERVIAGISFAGGAVIEPGHVKDHDGHFVIGELDGSITPRVQEIARIMEAARPARAVPDIRKWQWEKLSSVSMSVPAAAVSGMYHCDVFYDPMCMQLFAQVALEIYRVAEADGCHLDQINGKPASHWQDVADGKSSGLPGPDDFIPNFPREPDAYTKDMRLGRPLEVDYTNGAVVRIGARYGIPTPVNELLVRSIHEIADGKLTASRELAEAVIAAGKKAG